MSIGQRIGRLRRERGYSQEYVAESLGVSRQAVSKWETDLSAPDTYNLIALSKLFGVSVEHIAVGESEKGKEAFAAAEVGYGKITTQKIIGFILLATGLISLVLGLLLTEILIILSVYFIIGGILCIAVRKRLWLIIIWAFLIAACIILTFMTGVSLFGIFMPWFYKGAFTLEKAAAAAFWILLLIAVWLTVRALIKNKRKK